MKALYYLDTNNVNPELGYTMRMNYSSTEKFILHCHNYYEFFLTFGDPVIHIVNGQKQILPSRSLVFVRPDDTHTYIKDGDFSFINVAFSADTMKKLCAYFGDATNKILYTKMPPVVMLDTNDYNRVMQRLNSLNIINLNDKNRLQTRMKIILAEILSFFIDTNSNKTSSKIPYWLSSLVDFAKKAENINMTLDDMAVASKKSREHISRSFKKHYNLTVSEFMTEQKLNYCANLLLNSNLSVIDICYECGFQNLSWFYRKFKEKFGITPTVFRKNTKN